MADTPPDAPGSLPFELKPLDSPEAAPAPPPVPAAPAPADPAPRPSPDCPIPPPPPPIFREPIFPTAQARLLSAALVLVLFGRHWLSVGRADWLGGGLFALAATAVFFLDRRGGALRKAFGVGFFLLMAACFFGPAAADGKFSARLPLLVMIAGGLGLATALAGLYEGLFDSDEADQSLALGLLGAGGLVMLGCAACLASPEAGLGGALRGLGGHWGSFVETGGVWRWSALAVFYALSWVFFPPERKPQAGTQRVINWNL